jgi:DNA-directed RNA polymerase I subunit RPA43
MSTKKRKQLNTGNDVEIPPKRLKQEGKRDHGKGAVRDTEFHVVKASLVVSIPSIFASNARTGVEEMLDSMVMRSAIYLPLLCVSLKCPPSY